MRERVSRGWFDVAYDFGGQEPDLGCPDECPAYSWLEDTFPIDNDEALNCLEEYLAYHWPPNIWVALAKSLYLIIRSRYPYPLKNPNPDAPHLEVEFDLERDGDDAASAWVALLAFWPTRTRRVDLVFSDAGVEVRGERGRRVGGCGWEDPGIWDGILEWLAATGYPCDWNPEEALACGPVSQQMALAQVGSTVQLDP